MLAYRNGKLCLVYIDDTGQKKSSPIHIPWINKGCGNTSKEEYLKRLKEQLYKYVDESSNHRYQKITGITIDPPLPLDDYPNISTCHQRLETSPEAPNTRQTVGYLPQ